MTGKRLRTGRIRKKRTTSSRRRAAPNPMNAEHLLSRKAERQISDCVSRALAKAPAEIRKDPELFSLLRGYTRNLHPEMDWQAAEGQYLRAHLSLIRNWERRIPNPAAMQTVINRLDVEIATLNGIKSVTFLNRGIGRGLFTERPKKWRPWE